MRILVLSKRQYMSRDLIDDRYGRFRELPIALSSAGHKVYGICLSYRTRNEGKIEDIEHDAKVAWQLLNPTRLIPWTSNNYWRQTETIAKTFQPDLVWACSDALHAVLGRHIGKTIGVPVIIDLYDNFESYSLTRLPFVTMAFRNTLRKADGITCVSHPLAQYVRETSSCICPIEVIENAVPEGIFYPMDRAQCRRELGLPANGIFIGTAGAISKSRGIDTLFKAFEILAQERSDVQLVLAGSLEQGLMIPGHPRVHYLGMLHPNKVPVFLSTLNVSVICNRDSAFGKYCFPQKFYENVACGVPVVAAGTGSMLELLKNHPENLFEPDNVNQLTEVLIRQVKRPEALLMNVPTWNTLEKRLEQFFEKVVRTSTHSTPILN